MDPGGKSSKTISGVIQLCSEVTAKPLKLFAFKSNQIHSNSHHHLGLRSKQCTKVSRADESSDSSMNFQQNINQLQAKLRLFKKLLPGAIASTDANKAYEKSIGRLEEDVALLRLSLGIADRVSRVDIVTYDTSARSLAQDVRGLSQGFASGKMDALLAQIRRKHAISRVGWMTRFADRKYSVCHRSIIRWITKALIPCLPDM